MTHKQQQGTKHKHGHQCNVVPIDLGCNGTAFFRFSNITIQQTALFLFKRSMFDFLRDCAALSLFLLVCVCVFLVCFFRGAFSARFSELLESLDPTIIQPLPCRVVFHSLRHERPTSVSTASRCTGSCIDNQQQRQHQQTSNGRIGLQLHPSQSQCASSRRAHHDASRSVTRREEEERGCERGAGIAAEEAR